MIAALNVHPGVQIVFVAERELVAIVTFMQEHTLRSKVVTQISADFRRHHFWRGLTAIIGIAAVIAVAISATAAISAAIAAAIAAAVTIVSIIRRIVRRGRLGFQIPVAVVVLIQTVFISPGDNRFG